MLERKLLAACMKDRGAYDLVRESGVYLGEDLAPVWDIVRDFYDNDPSAQGGDIDLFLETAARASSSPKLVRTAKELVQQLWDTEVSVPNVRAIITEQRQEAASLALAAALAARRPKEEVDEALAAYEAAYTAVEANNEDDALDWRSVISYETDTDNRIAISPKVLNQYIRGGLLRGHNVTIFGRPESGKTALALSMACGFVRRGKKVLYIGNEDPIQDLMLRVVCNLSGMTAQEVQADPEAAEQAALDKGAALMIMKELAPGTVTDIDKLVRKYKPDVLFVDQLRNVRTGKSENYTQMLDQNAQAVRALGKKYGMITVSVTQAGDSATGKAVLDMGDVDSSNTGIPGAADVMIGVGVTPDLERQGRRMLSLCKNKPGHVKANQLVTLDPFRSRVQ